MAKPRGLTAISDRISQTGPRIDLRRLFRQQDLAFDAIHFSQEAKQQRGFSRSTIVRAMISGVRYMGLRSPTANNLTYTGPEITVNLFVGISKSRSTSSNGSESSSAGVSSGPLPTTAFLASFAVS